MRIRLSAVEKLRSTIVATMIAPIDNLRCGGLFKDAKETAPLKVEGKHDKESIYASIAQTSFFGDGLLKWLLKSILLGTRAVQVRGECVKVLQILLFFARKEVKLGGGDKVGLNVFANTTADSVYIDPLASRGATELNHVKNGVDGLGKAKLRSRAGVLFVHQPISQSGKGDGI